MRSSAKSKKHIGFNRYIDSSRLSELFLWLAYLVLLSFCYNYISKIWGYQGFENNLDPIRLTAGITAICLLLFLTSRAAPVVRICAGFIQALVLIPTVIIFAHSNYSWSYLGITFAASFLLLATGILVPARAFKAPKIPAELLARILTAISILNLAAVVAIGGISNVNFDLFRVYEFRESARDSLPGIFGYINSFTVRAALPFLFVLGLQQRNRHYVALSIAMSFAFFVLTANRLPLFQPLLLAGSFFALGRNGYIRWLAIGFLGIALAGLTSFLSWDSGPPPTIGMLTIYRGIFVPILANWQYIEYFGNYSDFFFWANSKLSLGLISSPDTLPMINVIGAEYWSGPHVAANAGWIGSGYGHAGLFGVFIYSVFFGGLLALMNGYSKRHGHRLVISLMLLPLIVGLTTADFVTLFLSQGMGASLLMLMALRPVTNIDTKNIHKDTGSRNV